METLKRLVLGLMGLGMSVFAVWRGIAMIRSPDRLLERAYKGMLVRGAERWQDWPSALTSLLWRIGGVVMVLGGCAFSWVMIQLLLGHTDERRVPEGPPPPPNGAQEWVTPLIGVLALILGIGMMIRPRTMLEVQVKLGHPGYGAREEMLAAFALRVRLVGAVLIGIGLYVLIGAIV